MRSAKPGVFGFSLIALLLLGGGVAAPYWNDSFAGFLAAHDAVFEATVVRYDSLTRSVLGSDRAVDVTVRVSKVLTGIVEDSILVVSSLGGPKTWDVTSDIRPGARILVWADRVEQDAWRLWGLWTRLTPEGQVVLPLDFQPTHEFRVATITKADLVASLVERQPIGEVFRTASALGIARVGKITGDMYDAGVRIPCDSLGWAMGSASHLPDTLTCRGLECLANFGRGDTILVPVPAGFTGGTYALPACPRGLRIKRGFVTSLAVPVEDLDRTLERRDEGFVIKSAILRSPR